MVIYLKRALLTINSRGKAGTLDPLFRMALIGMVASHNGGKLPMLKLEDHAIERSLDKEVETILGQIS